MAKSIELRGYLKPSSKILDTYYANHAYNMIVSRDSMYVIIAECITFPSIKRHINNIGKMAGDRYYLDTNINADIQFYKSIKVVSTDSESEYTYKLIGDDICHVNFSFDNKYIIYCSRLSNKNIIVVQTRSQIDQFKIIDHEINMLINPPYELSTNSNDIYFLEKSQNNIIPDKIVIEPINKFNERGSKIPQRTFPDLLKDSNDIDKFTNAFMSNIIKLNLDNMEYHEIIMNKCIRSFQLNSSYLLYEIYTEISTSVYSDYFGYEVRLWQTESDILIKSIPVENIMLTTHDSTHIYPRSFSWIQSNNTEYILWIDPIDNGNPSNKTEFSDAVMLYDIYTHTSKKIFSTKMRCRSVLTDTHGNFYITESSDKNKNAKITRVDYMCIGSDTIFEYDVEDLYNKPGSFITVKNSCDDIVLTDNFGNIYMRHMGHSSTGVYPYIYRYNLTTNEKTIIWSSGKNCYQSVIYTSIIYADYLSIIYSTQTTDSSPDYRMYHCYLGKKSIQNNSKLVTNYSYMFKQQNNFIMKNPSNYSHIRGYTEKLLQYNRADGIQLSANIYLPAGYTSGPRPIIIIAYPREFLNAKHVGQVRNSSNTFNYIRGLSWLYFLANGYIIVEDCDMPIIKTDGSEPNDTFIPQLKLNAQAIIDYLVENNYSNGNNIAIAGHSYGAFMVANLLTHTNYFTCGIARSGAYNRTLTPFGFQGEDRTLWDIPNTYLEMSPLLSANKINSPILLIHGESDPNPGTYPMQSERYYEALKGLGAEAQLVILPGESHGYLCEESILHSIAVCENFLQKYFN